MRPRTTARASYAPVGPVDEWTGPRDRRVVSLVVPHLADQVVAHLLGIREPLAAEAQNRLELGQ